MKFCLVINATHHWQSSAAHALDLAQQMLAQGHSINCVFFYGQAVKIAEQPNMMSEWQSWQTSSHSQLLLCSTQMNQHQVHPPASSSCFAVVGLASLTDAMAEADRTVELS